jgi:hypothetical protein
LSRTYFNQEILQRLVGLNRLLILILALPGVETECKIFVHVMEQGKAGIPSYSSYQTLLHLQLVAIEEYE